MEEEKGRFLDILIKEKNNIAELKNILGERSKISSNINEVKEKLKEINDMLKFMEDTLKIKEKEIGFNYEKIEALYFDLVIEDIDKVVEIIQDNLPNGYEGTITEDGIAEQSLKCIILRDISCYESSSKKEKKFSEEIGRIEIFYNEDKQFKVMVTIRDKNNLNIKEEEFILSKPYRIYKIIAYINANLSYNE